MFEKVGCRLCHTRSLPLAERRVWLYSDLLLHDLGAGLARTIREAILVHGGEAAKARERFRQLSTSERETVIAFLKGL